MKIVVFSGTTEGRDFSRAAAALGIAVTVSVATDLGAEEQGQAPGITVHSGRLLPGAMAELLQGAALCVDATHPYAVEATKNIRAAANAAGVEYHRLLRAASTLPAGSVVLGSAAQAAQYLARLDFGWNVAPHSQQRFTSSRSLMISAYRAASNGRTAA